jgi:hypothetical protein
MATGGIYDAQTQMASFNFVEPYLRSVFGFLGVTDATFLTAGGTSVLNQGHDRNAFLAPHVQSVRNTMLDECFSYNDELRKNGHLVAEEPLQPANTAVTVYWKNGKVAVTDGPYAETKEQLGGIQVLEARDLNHAIQLISGKS